MQVFIIDSPLETVKLLNRDKRRVHAQITEAKMILNMIKDVKTNQNSRWKNQPLVKMYVNDVEWLVHYLNIFELYKIGEFDEAEKINIKATNIKPVWHSKEYFDQMKRRLYTKDSKRFIEFQELGMSYDNWYWIDNKWKKYPQK